VHIRSVTVGLPARDFEKAVAWYGRVLGPRTTIAPVESVVEMELVPGCWLQFQRAEKDGAAGAVLRLGVDDIDSEVARLTSLGVAIEPIRRIPGVVALCGFTDPWGRALSLYEVL
jgi:predicted enzyme related to lactoylglutathione lyase